MKVTCHPLLVRAAAALAIFAALVASPLPGAAQNLFDPVAKVDERVVTAYELSQRMAFLRLLRAPGDIGELAIDQLVNERLQLSAAKQMNLKLSDEQLATGMAEFAARASMDTEQFLTAIAGGGVAAESFRDFVIAGMLWREVVKARFARQVQVSDAEIDQAIALAEPKPGTRVLLSEITLPGGDAATKKASLARGEELSKISDLPEFASAARRYSVSATRARSGELDWIDVENLPPQVAARVLALSAGGVTRPIETETGVVLYQLREIKQTGTIAPGAVNIDYAMFYIPGGQTPTALAEAQLLRDKVDTCDDLYGVARDLPEDRLLREETPPAELPSDVALELARMDDNEISTALTRSGGETLVFLMLCERIPVAAADISREAVLNQLRNRRLATLADAYLKELRSVSHIEIVAR